MITFEQIDVNDLPEFEQFVPGSHCNSTFLYLLTSAKDSEMKQKM